MYFSVGASISKSRITWTELSDTRRSELGRLQEFGRLPPFPAPRNGLWPIHLMTGMVASIADKLTAMKQEREQ